MATFCPFLVGTIFTEILFDKNNPEATAKTENKSNQNLPARTTRLACCYGCNAGRSNYAASRRHRSPACRKASAPALARQSTSTTPKAPPR